MPSSQSVYRAEPTSGEWLAPGNSSAHHTNYCYERGNSVPQSGGNLPFCREIKYCLWSDRASFSVAVTENRSFCPTLSLLSSSILFRICLSKKHIWRKVKFSFWNIYNCESRGEESHSHSQCENYPSSPRLSISRCCPAFLSPLSSPFQLDLFSSPGFPSLWLTRKWSS